VFPDPINNNVIDTNSSNTNSKLMKEREVPSTPMARLMGFGSLGARMMFGFASDRATQFVTGNNQGKLIVMIILIIMRLNF